jgi:lysophospholipase L1-like esterase
MSEPENLTFGRKLLFSATALALFIVLLAAAGLAGEAFMRAIGPASDGQKIGLPLPDSERRYGLKPNIASLQGGVMVKTNSLGFREREYPVARKPGVRRIVVLGDSYTQGVGVEFEETYTKRLEAELNRSGGPTEVINFGVGGYSTSLELATLREVAARFRPDLIIVGYVLNDVDPDNVSGAAPEKRGAASGRASPLLKAHNGLKRHSLLYRWLAPKLGAVLGLFGGRYAFGMTNYLSKAYDDDAPGWIRAREALLGIAAESRSLGADLLVVVFPMIIDFRTYPLAHAHEAVTGFCRQHGIEVLDLLPRFRREDAARLTLFLDGHPNSRGHAIFAEEIYAALQPDVMGGFSKASRR